MIRIHFSQLCALVHCFSSSVQCSQVNERACNEAIRCSLAPRAPASAPGFPSSPVPLAGGVGTRADGLQLNNDCKIQILLIKMGEDQPDLSSGLSEVVKFASILKISSYGSFNKNICKFLSPFIVFNVLLCWDLQYRGFYYSMLQFYSYQLTAKSCMSWFSQYFK